MSVHGLPGAAEVARSPGCRRRTGSPGQAEGGERPAGERGASGSGEAFRPFRYRDLGSADYSYCGRT